MTEKIPKIIIIVPYRDREEDRKEFIKRMPTILKHLQYKIFIIHQHDKRLFNRGAIKNIGFLAVKERYPHHYKDITLVFNDVDTMPRRKYQFSYNTHANSVNHFYGYTQTLGGIFAIKGQDFERINGFPNIWTWGLEDNSVKMRCDKHQIPINRKEFISWRESHKILALPHGNKRIISPNIEPKLSQNSDTDGISTLFKIKYQMFDIAPTIEEVLVDHFETPEGFSSPFIKFARLYDQKLFPTLDKQIKVINNKVTILSGKRSHGKLLFH